MTQVYLPRTAGREAPNASTSSVGRMYRVQCMSWASHRELPARSFDKTHSLSLGSPKGWLDSSRRIFTFRTALEELLEHQYLKDSTQTVWSAVSKNVTPSSCAVRMTLMPCILSAAGP